MLHRIAFVLTLSLAAACGGKNTPPSGGGDTTPPAPVTLGEPNNEIVGGLTLGDPAAKVEATLGAPSTKDEVVEWAATGDRVSEWNWNDKGVRLQMAERDGGFAILSLYIQAPSTLTTSRGIGVGATFADVDRVYGEFKGKWLEDGEEQNWDPETGVTVGSVYGGTMFSFTDGKVSSVFVGAAAE